MRFHWSWYPTIAFLFLSPACGAAGDLHIRYAEPISLQAGTNFPTSLPQSLEPDGRLSFQAYGRQFDLALESNARLARELAVRPGAPAAYRLLRGHIEGLPGSWVRLTRIGAELHGAIWDGNELYTIEPARVVNRFAVNRLAVDGAAPVVYRLSDTDASSMPLSCGATAPDGRRSALSAYQSLVGELEADPMFLGTGSGGELDIAVIADYEFYNTHNGNTEAELLARMNIVDGIFSSQLGVNVVVTQLRVFSTPSEPFTTDTGSDLLDEVARYRSNSPTLRTAGLAHLITGRDIADNMAGIAYVGTVCDSAHGVGISEGRYDLTTTALIAAHEIGHNFGATHDGEAGSPCQSTATIYLMAARINGNNTFSQCSLEHMWPMVARASCLALARVADASVADTPAMIKGTTGAVLELPVEVSSVGSAQLQDVMVAISLPAPVAVDVATVPGGSCATGAGGATCELGPIEVGGSRRVSVGIRTPSVGTFASIVSVSTPNDANAANDQRVVSLVVKSTSSSTATGDSNGNAGGGGGAIELGLLLALGAALRRCSRGRS